MFNKDMFNKDICNIITKYTFKSFKCEIFDNYPYLGSYNLRRGKVIYINLIIMN